MLSSSHLADPCKSDLPPGFHLAFLIPLTVLIATAFLFLSFFCVRRRYKGIKESRDTKRKEIETERRSWSREENDGEYGEIREKRSHNDDQKQFACGLT